MTGSKKDKMIQYFINIIINKRTNLFFNWNLHKYNTYVKDNKTPALFTIQQISYFILTLLLDIWPPHLDKALKIPVLAILDINHGSTGER